jgi:hypothetical protein
MVIAETVTLHIIKITVRSSGHSGEQVEFHATAECHKCHFFWRVVCIIDKIHVYYKHKEVQVTAQFCGKFTDLATTSWLRYVCGTK